METKKEKLEKAHIVGIELRTSYKEGRYQREIPLHLERFFKEGILEKIPCRISDSIYVLYTSYESDYKGTIPASSDAPSPRWETFQRGLYQKRSEETRTIQSILPRGPFQNPSSIFGSLFGIPRSSGPIPQTLRYTLSTSTLKKIQR